MLSFLFAFFLKISKTLEAHISGERKQISNGKKVSFRFPTVFHISQYKNYEKFRCICTLRTLKRYSRVSYIRNRLFGFSLLFKSMFSQNGVPKFLIKWFLVCRPAVNPLISSTFSV